MNRITRLLAIAGLGIGAAVALAGPAQAATSNASNTSSATSRAHWGDDNRVVGVFDSRGACEHVGHMGEIRGQWDDYDCNHVRIGFHRGDWELSVSDGGNWGGGFHHGGPFGGPFHHGGPFGGPFHHGGPFGGPFRGPRL
jgi:hypothetical protein